MVPKTSQPKVPARGWKQYEESLNRKTNQLIPQRLLLMMTSAALVSFADCTGCTAVGFNGVGVTPGPARGRLLHPADGDGARARAGRGDPFGG
eukprot:6726792-Pyramimonas_sp.AAC.1